MGYFISVISIICISFFYQTFFKRKFAETIAVSVLTVNILLYIITYFLTFRIASFTVVALSFVGLCYTVVNEVFYVKKNGFAIKKYISYPFIFYCVIVVIIFITLNGLLATIWDEFSHWMLINKNIYVMDNLGVGEFYFSNYPTVPGLFETYFTIFEPAFYEDNTFMGLSVCMVSLLFLPLANINGFWKKTVFIIASVLSPLLFFAGPEDEPFAYRSVYADCLLGVSFAFFVSAYFLLKKRDIFFLITVILSGVHLILVKPTGIILFILAVMIMGSDILVFSKKDLKDTNGKYNLKRIILASLVVIVPILFKLSWNIYLQIYTTNIYNNISGGSDVFFGIMSVLQGNAPEYVTDIINSFFNIYFSPRSIFSTIALPYFSFIVISIFVMFLVGKYTSNIKRCITLGISLALTHVIYSAAICATYLFVFPNRSGASLPSYNRYLATINMGISIVLFFVSVNPYVLKEGEICEKDDRDKPFIECLSLLFSVFILCNTSSSINSGLLQSGSAVDYSNDLRNGYKTIKEMSERMVYKKDKVYFLSQASNGFDYYIARYYLSPVEISPQMEWAISYKKASLHKVCTAEEWGDILKNEGYTYVYVGSTDNYLNDYAELFDSGDIQAQMLYSVSVTEDGRVNLVPDYDYVPRENMLKNVTSFKVYLKRLLHFKDNCLIIASVNDDACWGLNEYDTELLSELGFDLDKFVFRNSYISVIDKGSMIYEENSETDVLNFSSDITDDLHIDVESGGFYAEASSQISINDIEYAVGSRGINFVVYDYETKSVIDSVCFDIYDSKTFSRLSSAD